MREDVLAVSQEFAKADDDGELIAEVVCDAAGQLSDGLHLLRLQKLGLKAALVGQIAAKHGDAGDLAVGGVHGIERYEIIAAFAMFVGGPEYRIRRFHRRGRDRGWIGRVGGDPEWADRRWNCRRGGCRGRRIVSSCGRGPALK